MSSNKFYSVYVQFLSLVLVTFLLSACRGAVTLSNKTNVPDVTPSAYDPARDIFLYGATSWDYKLKVVSELRGVPSSSIKAFVVIGNKTHKMQLVGNWKGNESLWIFEKDSSCGDTGANPVSNLNYKFLVDYSRQGILPWTVVKPPAKLPRSGQYSSRLINLGIAFEPTAPYPNQNRNQGVIYDQNCWQTGAACAPTWKDSKRVGAGWPGPSSSYEHSLKLVNPEPSDAIISDLRFSEMGGDTSSYTLFEIVNPTGPVTVPACGGTAVITLRYKPGYGQLSSFTPGHYPHDLMLRSKIQWPGMGSPGNGPSIRINYEVSYNPG